ncbi:protein FAM200B-like [Thrips palmi]|uniref:Protein FAM200B-like n=1 Tax=Thrips palmi TaxID=161013 RepID=A0A6P9ADI7_THRPL|nr:protein FAM200B-like [Thrips palmi]
MDENEIESYNEDNPDFEDEENARSAEKRQQDEALTTTPPKKGKKSISKPKIFKDEWLADSTFMGWLKKVHGKPHKAVCSACDVELAAGKSELQKHAEGKLHKKKAESLKANKSLTEMFSQAQTAQREAAKHSERVKVAEIQMAAFFADNNVAFRTSTQLVGVQKKVFKDSKIVQDMTLGPDKCNAIVRNVIAKVETEELAEDLRNTYFSTMVDESTDQGAEKNLIIVVKFLSPRAPGKDKPRVTILELARLDSTNCSAEALWNAYDKVLEKHRIPHDNCIGLSCDGAAVMVGRHNSFWSRLKERCPWAILMPCTCHSAAKVSSIACSKLPSHVEQHLRMLSTYLGGSPKRSAELRQFQEEYEEELKKMLKPAATRWLVLQPCVERYLLLRKQRSLQGFFELRCFEDPDRKDKDAHEILAQLKNPFTGAYMEFLSYVLNVMNEFNAMFQSKSTLIHKVYERSHALMKTLCLNFMKEDCMDKLGDINVTHPHFLLPLEEVELGLGCNEALSKITPHPDTPETRQALARDITAFRQKCLHFYTTAAKEIQCRLPLKDEILRQASFLDPAVFLQPRSEPGALKDINGLIMHYKDKLNLDVNATVLEWRKVPHTIPQRMHEKLKAMPMEDAWDEIRALKSGDDKPMFGNLVKLANLVMVLPHANADAERGFSIVTDVKTKKRNRMGAECLNSICVARSSFRSKGIDCVSFEVTPKHLSKHNKDMYNRE